MENFVLRNITHHKDSVSDSAEIKFIDKLLFLKDW